MMMLKVALSPTKPNVNGSRATGVPHIPTIETHFLELLTSRLGLTYSLVSPADGEYGSQRPDGTFTGVTGLVASGQADMAVSYMAVTETRARATEFSVAYTTMDQTFVVARPSPVPKMMVYAYPLSPAVWGGVCLVTLLVAGLMAATSRSALVEVFFSLFGNVFRQPSTHRLPSGMRARILLGTWWVFAWMVGVFYSATFLSFLSVPLLEKGIRNLDEMIAAVEGNGYRCLVPKGSFFLDHLRHSRQHHLRELGELIWRENWVYDVRENIAGYLHGRTVLLGNSLRFQGPLFDAWRFSEEGFGTWNVAVIIGRSFCCRRRLDQLLMRVVAAGLYDKIVRDETWRSGLGFVPDEEKESTVQPLKLEDVMGVFVFLGLGFLVAMAVLCVEIWIVGCGCCSVSRRRSRRKTRRRRVKRISTVGVFNEKMTLNRQFQLAFRHF